MLLKLLTRLLSSILLFFLVQGCSSTTKAYLDSFKLIYSAEDILLTLDQVKASPVDILEVKHGDRKKAIMALAYIEKDGYKWVSADQAILIINNGIITRTIGLPVDLLSTTNVEDNPLKNIDANKLNWERYIDLNSGSSGLKVTSSWNRVGIQKISILGSEIEAIKIIETVICQPNSRFFEKGQSWKNVYFIDKHSGLPIRVKQKYAPNAEQIEFTFLSRAARMIAEGAN